MKDETLQRAIEAVGELLEATLNQLSVSDREAVGRLLEAGEARVDVRFYPATANVSGYLVMPQGETPLFSVGPQAQ